MSLTNANGGSKVDLLATPPGFSGLLEKNGPIRHDYRSSDIMAENSSKPLQRLLNPSDLSSPHQSDETAKNPERSKSFAKLAAALGEGLAESMDVSVFEDQKIDNVVR
jgi:hypothetical protein